VPVAVLNIGPTRADALAELRLECDAAQVTIHVEGIHVYKCKYNIECMYIPWLVHLECDASQVGSLGGLCMAVCDIAVCGIAVCGIAVCGITVGSIGLCVAVSAVCALQCVVLQCVVLGCALQCVVCTAVCGLQCVVLHHAPLPTPGEHVPPRRRAAPASTPYNYNII
jgi:hypothetical protein